MQEFVKVLTQLTQLFDRVPEVDRMRHKSRLQGVDVLGAFMKSGQHLLLGHTAGSRLGEWREQLGVDYDGNAEDIPTLDNGSRSSSIGGSSRSSDDFVEFHDMDEEEPLPRSLDFSKWTVEDVGNWLEESGLAPLKEMFSEQAVNGAALPHLTEANILILAPKIGHQGALRGALSALIKGKGKAKEVASAATPKTVRFPDFSPFQCPRSISLNCNQ